MNSSQLSSLNSQLAQLQQSATTDNIIFTRVESVISSNDGYAVLWNNNDLTKLAIINLTSNAIHLFPIQLSSNKTICCCLTAIHISLPKERVIIVMANNDTSNSNSGGSNSKLAFYDCPLLPPNQTGNHSPVLEYQNFSSPNIIQMEVQMSSSSSSQSQSIQLLVLTQHHFKFNSDCYFSLHYPSTCFFSLCF